MKSPKVGDRICISAIVTGNNGVADTFCRNIVLQLTTTGTTCVATGTMTFSTAGSISQNAQACVFLREVRGYK